MNNRGFTLVEMLVVMAIFLTLMLVVSDIFLSVSITQRRTFKEQTAMSNMQTALRQISEIIRSNKIDYQTIEQLAFPNNEPLPKMLLVNDNQESVEIYQSQQACPDQVVNCLKQKIGAQISTLSADNVEIEQLNFYLEPRDDPFVYNNGYASDQQPMVTIVVVGRIVDEPDARLLNLQTSISPRFYGR